MVEQQVGTMEDTGDTYPVCDTCGYIGTSRTRDGDPCPECEERTIPESLSELVEG